MVAVNPPATQGQQQPAAHAPAPAANATDNGGVSNDAGPQPGADVGGISYGGGLISQDYGYGGGGGGSGGASSVDLAQGGSPVFPGGVQSFQVRARAAGTCPHQLNLQSNVLVTSSHLWIPVVPQRPCSLTSRASCSWPAVLRPD